MANTASLIITLFFFSGFSLSCRVYAPARMPYCVSRAMRPAKWAMSPLRTIVARAFPVGHMRGILFVRTMITTGRFVSPPLINVHNVGIFGVLVFFALLSDGR